MIKRLARTVPWFVVALTWVLLTLTLSAAMAHSAPALRVYVTPRLPDGVLLVVALVLGFLLGAVTPSSRVLFPLTLAMPFVAAAVFGAVVYSPAWAGLIARTGAFANYAQQQALFMLIWTTGPVVVGVVAGYTAGESLRRNSIDSPQSDGRTSWWS